MNMSVLKFPFFPPLLVCRQVIKIYICPYISFGQLHDATHILIKLTFLTLLHPHHVFPLVRRNSAEPIHSYNCQIERLDTKKKDTPEKCTRRGQTRTRSSRVRQAMTPLSSSSARRLPSRARTRQSRTSCSKRRLKTNQARFEQ